jgi:AAA family ATPase
MDMEREGLVQGDFVSIRSEDSGLVGIGIISRTVEGNPGSHKNTANPIIRMSDFLREKYSFELQDKYQVERWEKTFRTIETITVTNLTDSRVAIDSIKAWVPYALASLDCVASNGTFEVTPRIGPSRFKRHRFLVEQIEPKDDKDVMKPFIFELNKSRIVYKNLETGLKSPVNGVPELAFDFKGLIGLDDQLEELKGHITDGSLSFREKSTPVLLFGSAGTGKSTILNRLKEGNWSKVFSIDQKTVIGGESKAISRLEDIFDQAKRSRPSLITIDAIDGIASKGDVTAVSEILAYLIADSRSSSVQVVASSRRYLDVQERLVDAFMTKIELPLPKVQSRVQILTSICQKCDTRVLGRVAERTHAFSAHDMDALWIAAKRAAHTRTEKRRKEAGRPKSIGDDGLVTSPKVLDEDFEVALQRVHATTMNAIYVEVPKVYWSDIGGSQKTKEVLQNVIMEFNRVFTPI